ncbi:MAG: hypothetical protein ABI597_11840, partial [Gammaproteobacteria bacterium]
MLTGSGKESNNENRESTKYFTNHLDLANELFEQKEYLKAQNYFVSHIVVELSKKTSLAETNSLALTIINKIHECNLKLQKKEVPSDTEKLAATAKMLFDQNTLEGYTSARKYFKALIYHHPKDGQLYINRAACNSFIMENQSKYEILPMINLVLIDLNIALWLHYTGICILSSETALVCIMKKCVCLMRIQHRSWLDDCVQTYQLFKMHAQGAESHNICDFFRDSAKEQQSMRPGFAKLCNQLAAKLDSYVEEKSTLDEQKASVEIIEALYQNMPKLPSFINYLEHVNDSERAVELIAASLRKCNPKDADFSKAAKLIHDGITFITLGTDLQWALHHAAKSIAQAAVICELDSLSYAHQFRNFRCLNDEEAATRYLNLAIESENNNSNKLAQMYFYLSRADIASSNKDFAAAKEDILTAIRLDPRGTYPANLSQVAGVNFNLAETGSQIILSSEPLSAATQKETYAKWDQAIADFHAKSYASTISLTKELLKYKVVQSEIYAMLAICCHKIPGGEFQGHLEDYLDLAIWLTRTKGSSLPIRFLIELYEIKMIRLCLLDKYEEAKACYEIGLEYFTLADKQTYQECVAKQLGGTANKPKCNSDLQQKLFQFAASILPKHLNEKFIAKPQSQEIPKDKSKEPEQKQTRRSTSATVITVDENGIPDFINYLANAKSKTEKLKLIEKSLNKCNQRPVDSAGAAQLIYEAIELSSRKGSDSSQIADLFQRAGLKCGRLDVLTQIYKMKNFYKRNDYQAAIDSIDIAIYREKEFDIPNRMNLAYLYFSQAGAYLALKEKSKAKESILTGIRLDPYGTYPLQRAMIVGIAFSRCENLSDEPSKSPEDMPNMDSMLIQSELAFSEYGNRNYIVALKLFYELVKAAPACGGYYAGISDCLYNMGNRKFKQDYLDYLDVALWLMRTETSSGNQIIVLSAYAQKIHLLCQIKKINEEALSTFKIGLSYVLPENRDQYVKCIIESIGSLIDKTDTSKENLEYIAQLDNFSLTLYKVGSSKMLPSVEGYIQSASASKITVKHDSEKHKSANKPNITATESKKTKSVNNGLITTLPEFINYTANDVDRNKKVERISRSLEDYASMKKKGKNDFKGAADLVVRAIDFCKSQNHKLQLNAISIIDSIEQDYQIDYLVYVTKIQAYLGVARYEDALKSLDSATSFERSQASHNTKRIAYYYFLRSEIYLAQNNLAEAKANILKGIREDFDNTYPARYVATVGIAFNQCEKITPVRGAPKLPISPFKSFELINSAFSHWGKQDHANALKDYYALSALEPTLGTCYGAIAICRYILEGKKFKQEYLDYLDVALWLIQTNVCPIKIPTSFIVQYFTAKIDLLCMNKKFDDAKTCYERGDSYFKPNAADHVSYQTSVASTLLHASKRDGTSSSDELTIHKLIQSIFPLVKLNQTTQEVLQQTIPTPAAVPETKSLNDEMAEREKAEKLAKKEAAKKAKGEQNKLAEEQKKLAEAKEAEDNARRLEKKRLAEENRQKEAAAKKQQKQEIAKINKAKKAEEDKRLQEEREAEERKLADENKIKEAEKTAKIAQKKAEKAKVKRLKQEAEKAAEEAKVKAQQEAKAEEEREQARSQAKADEEARLKAEQEEKERLLQEKLAQDELAKSKAQEEARLKTQEAKQQAETEQLKKESEAKNKKQIVIESGLPEEKFSFTMNTPDVVNYVFDRLFGFENYIGGSAIPDVLEGKSELTTDLDLYTSAKFNQYKDRFKNDEIVQDCYNKNLAHLQGTGKITVSLYSSDHLSNKKILTKAERLKSHAQSGVFTYTALFAERTTATHCVITDPTGRGYKDFSGGRIVTLDPPEMSLTADFTRYFRAIDSISKLPNRYGRPFILDTDLAVQLHKL